MRADNGLEPGEPMTNDGPCSSRRGAAARAARASVCAAIACSALLIGAGAAQAASSHVLAGSFGAPGSGAGELSLAANSGVAVNATTHDIYIADTENHRVAEFDSAGTFVRAWGWGVADGVSEELQSCTLSCSAGLSGAGAGQFEAPTFIAVDNDPSSPSFEDVYVADTGDRLVTKFDATGKLEEAWGDHQNAKEEAEPNGQLSGAGSTGGPFLNEFGSSVAGVAVDLTGNLWVYTTNSRMVEFDQSGTFTKEWGGNGARQAGIAVDGAQNVYLVNGFEQVEKLTPEGSPLGTLTTAPEEGNGVNAPTGLAVDQTRGEVYVDSGKSVRHISRACNPSFGPCPAEETFGFPQLSAGAGVAVDSSNATVYAVDSASGLLYEFTQALEVDTGPATDVTASAATATGSIDPEGSPVTGCRFEYGESEEYGKSVPCSGPSELTTPASVQAELTGLRGGITYHYRLVAKNEAGGLVHGEDETFSTSPTAVIAALSTLGMTGDSAELSATVNPVGIPITSCHFDYGTTTSYALSVPCAQSPGAIGSGNSPVPVSATIGGLSPNTTYHWRLVVVDENGATESADQTFVFTTTNASLPDGRQYELVTPVRKNGGLIGKLFAFIPPQVAGDGSRVIAATDQCFPGAPSCVGDRQNNGEPYEFLRTSSGWTPHPLAAPATTFATSSYWSFNPNADTVLFSVPSPPAGQDDFYAREASGAFAHIGSIGEGPKLGNYENLTKEGMLSTADLSHVVYETFAPAWSFDETESERSSLYERVGTGGGQPLLVGVTGASGSTSLVSRCGVRLGNPEQGFSKLYRSLSEDGRTVFFTASRCSSGSGGNEGVEVPASELYARIDGERGDAHTVLISGPTTESCTTSECKENTDAEKQAERARDASYAGASADGSTVVFADTQQLTDTATQDPASSDTAFQCGSTTNEASGCNLYASICPTPCAQPATERRLVDISAAPAGGPRVQTTLTISPDGSHIYFVAKGVLSEAPNARGQIAHSGSENLYVYERDAAFPQGHLAFIAGLSEGDLGRLGSANVTPDGRRLVFLSRRGLTADAARAEGPAQVYEYDDESKSLTRLSIGQNGFNNNGNAGVGDARLSTPFSVDEATSVPERSDPTMSHDGAYVFFQSPIALTPQALSNVQVGSLDGEPLYAQNVYEYHEGKVSLISDGKDVSVGAGFPPRGVELLGSDASGENVFFSTADPLVTQDTDTQLDIYDAHLCSAGSPCIPQTAPPSPACEAEACHGPPGGAPAQQTPGSATFSGEGNLPPTTAPKPKPLTRAQKLAKALKSCRTKHNRHKRTVCERQARKKYGTPAKKAARHHAAKKGSHR
jgi:sugar lactone lactonase YvrE